MGWSKLWPVGREGEGGKGGGTYFEAVGMASNDVNVIVVINVTGGDVTGFVEGRGGEEGDIEEGLGFALRECQARNRVTTDVGSTSPRDEGEG